VLLVLLALACVAAVPLSGRRLEGLLDLRFRWNAAAFIALALQVVITELGAGGDHRLHAGLHLLSYGLAGAFLIANRAVGGLWVIALGGACNLLAIAANSGVMPASAAALSAAHVPRGSGFENSAAIVHPHLMALGDVIPVPAPLGLGNVLSVGDLILYAGALVVLFKACRPADRLSRPGAPASRSQTEVARGLEPPQERYT
jgi:hypothetical protein